MSPKSTRDVERPTPLAFWLKSRGVDPTDNPFTTNNYNLAFDLLHGQVKVPEGIEVGPLPSGPEVRRIREALGLHAAWMSDRLGFPPYEAFESGRRSLGDCRPEVGDKALGFRCLLAVGRAWLDEFRPNWVAEADAKASAQVEAVTSARGRFDALADHLDDVLASLASTIDAVVTAVDAAGRESQPGAVLSLRNSLPVLRDAEDRIHGARRQIYFDESA